MTLELMARIIEAEASVLDFQGKLAVAQCICDNRFDESAFTKPADYYSPESMMAAELAVNNGARRFVNAKLLQFRSFTNYGKDGVPDWEKIYNSVPYDLLYLGDDRKSEYGHYYFGNYTKMWKPFRLLLIAGHGRNVDGSYDPGAIGCGYREADLNRELVKLIKKAADRNNLPCDVAPDRNYYSWFKHGGTFDFKPYNYVLEVHFNAGGTVDEVGDGAKRGSMFYIDQSETGHSVEDTILQNLYNVGSKQAWDGVVITQRQWPEGLMVQNRVRAQGVSEGVLETCFITDRDDINWYEKKKRLIATEIVQGIIDGFGLSKQENPYGYVGKGIGSAEALEDMNVRMGTSVYANICGLVEKGQEVEVLDKFQTGWMKIVWPGVPHGYAYTSNVGGHYYKYE